MIAVLVLAAGLGAAAPRSAALERTSLSPDESAAVNRAVRYLNNISTMQARFIQVSSNGTYAEGEVILQRPGKLRFDYDPPHPVLIIANGLSLLFYDRELKQASFLPLWETPLWFLIRERVRLSDDVVVSGVELGHATLRITLQDRTLEDAGSVTLVFSDRPLGLKRWEITDAQGVVTQVSLLDPRFGEEVDEEVFDYSDLEIRTGDVKRDGP